MGIVKSSIVLIRLYPSFRLGSDVHAKPAKINANINEPIHVAKQIIPLLRFCLIVKNNDNSEIINKVINETIKPKLKR